ncbi:MAG: methyltransferase domain-containing protein [Acidobacteriota bacterium]
MLKPLIEDAKDYYDKHYRKKFSDSLCDPTDDPERIFEARKDHQADRLRIVAPFADPDASLLEVGCSAGQFLTHVAGMFRCQGLELNDRCAAFVRERLGIPVHTQELSALGLPDASFDAVAAFQVLEHMADPRAFLLEARRLLKPGGRLFIEVPNLHDALRVLWKVPAYRTFYFHEAHTFYFSAASLEKLFGQCGLNLEATHFLQDYNVFNHVYWYFNNAPQPDCSFGLAPPHFPLEENLADAASQVNELCRRFDASYKDLLAKAGLSSNMFLVATAS